MTKHITTSLTKRPAAPLCCALAILLLPLAALAGESHKDRYECVARVGGRTYTNGAIELKGHPCRVDPEEVDRLVKTGAADKKTDQVNFDYFWNQEYYTRGRSLTYIRDAGEEQAADNPAAPPAQPETAARENVETSTGAAAVPDIPVIPPAAAQELPAAAAADEADGDGDGVPDTADKCPGTAPRTVVDQYGCTPQQTVAAADSDGDGFQDSSDQCPATPAGVAVDSGGCPIP